MQISQKRYKKILKIISNCQYFLDTTDPFKICRLLDIKIHFIPLSDNLCGFADVSSSPIIYISSTLDSYSQKIVCAHELGHILLHRKEELNLFERDSELKSLQEYEANLFAIELMPQIYNDSLISYLTLNEESLQSFMNKKIKHVFFTL